MEEKISRLMLGSFAAFIIQAGLGPWLLFGAPLAGIALNVYVAAGFASLFFSLVSGLLRRDPRRQVFEEFVTDNAKKQMTLNQRWRNRIYQAIFFVLRICCWPAFEAYNLRLAALSALLRTQFEMGAAVNLYPPETSLSVSLFVLPAAVTVYAALLAPPSTFSVDFLWLLVFALFLKHFSYIIGVQTVQERLRRGQDSPLLSYALITVCDFLGLILCYNGIVNWPSDSIFQPLAITPIISRLFALKDLIGAYEHPPQRLIDYFIGVSGLLWWATLATSLIQFLWKNYQRTALDYLHLALSYTLLGMDDRARAALDAADVTEKLPSALKGELHAALGDFDKATIYIRRYLAQAEAVPSSPKDLNYVFQELYGGITTFRSTSDMLCRYIEYGSGNGLSDVLLAYLAIFMGDVGINPQPVAQFMEEGGLIERFPLGYMAVKWAADEEQKVLDRFDQSEPKEPDAGRAAWLCFLALLWPARRKSREETLAFVEKWARSSLPEIQKIAVDLEDQLAKIALIGLLGQTEFYWKGMGAGIPTTNAVIAGSLDQNEVIRRILPAAQPQKASEATTPSSTLIPAAA